MSEPEPSQGWPGESGTGAAFEFETRNLAGERPELFRRLREFGRGQQWLPAIASEVELVLEEWITDVLDYGVDLEPAPFFKVQIFCDQPLARIVALDNGVPFDPTSVPPPDVRLPAEERPVGGLGIFMMRNLSQSMTYDRQNGLNVLTIRKSLREPCLARQKVA